MTRSTTLATGVLCAALLPLLASCNRATPPATPAQADVDTAATDPAPAADPAAAPAPAQPDASGDAGTETVSTGGDSGELSADRLATLAALSSAGDGQAFAGNERQGPDYDALRQAADRLTQINQRNRAIEAGKPQSAPATRAPGNAPANPRPVPVTGDSAVPPQSGVARDVVRNLSLLFEHRTKCTVIDGIQTRAVSAEGPFNTNAQGKLVSGTLLDRWTVRGCGQQREYSVLVKIRPDATVDTVIGEATAR